MLKIIYIHEKKSVFLRGMNFKLCLPFRRKMLLKLSSIGAIMVVIVPVQLVPITSKAVSLSPAQSNKVCSIQHYVMKFVSDLRQVCGFLQALRFPPPIKL